MVFTDVNNGWAAGYNGTILHTIDGGTNWNLESSGTSQHLFSIQFPSDSIGFALGENGTALKYADGQWTSQASGTDNRIYSSRFVDENNGWASGANETIIHTSDGGSTWENQSAIHDEPFHSIYFLDSNNGWCVSDGYLSDGSRYGLLFKTTDAGMTWQQKFSLGGYVLHSVFFINQNTGWIVGSNGLTMRSDDGGNSWYYQYVPAAGWLYSVFFINQNQGWITGDTDGMIYYTNNGGYTWNETYTGYPDWLFSVQFINQDTGWAAGDNGTIIHTTNGSTPVELISFTAENINKEVRLSWVTGSEINNKGFEIQRKLNDSYHKIAFIEGKGTNTESNRYNYTDKDLFNGDYFYRLKQIDYDGSFTYSNEIEININMPVEYGLKQNYPNPFNPVTCIEFTLPVRTRVSLDIYDALGQKVAEPINDFMESGRHTVLFNGNDLPSGVYYYRLSADNFCDVKKLLLIK